MTSPTERWRILARATERVKRPAVRDQVGTSARAKMYLYDVIDSWGGPFGISASEFLDSLAALGAVNEIELHINSPGGEVYEGIAIRNALRQHDAHVTAVVDGLAASAASFIAVGADEVVMAANSEMMIHNAHGIVLGNASDMRELADRLDHHDANIASMYAAKAGGDVADWQSAMSAETWYSADEAVTAGLADRTDSAPEDEAAVKDRYDLSIFNYAGRAKAPTPATTHGSPTQTPAAALADGIPEEGSTIVAFSDDSTATLRQKLGLADEADEATILAALDEALDERAEPQNSAPQLPEGVVAVDAAILDGLRADAKAGRQASERQGREDREKAVQDAVSTGRIAPARKQAWLDKLEADPAEVETLNSLQPGLVPVAEIGNAATGEGAEADDSYPAHWKH